MVLDGKQSLQKKAFRCFMVASNFDFYARFVTNSMTEGNEKTDLDTTNTT